MLKDGQTSGGKGKGACFRYVKLNLNELFNYPYLSHTLQAITDLFDPKSCELPTLVESDMLNKPIEPYTLTM